MSAPQPETEQIEFNEPDSNSVSQEMIKEESHRKETEDLAGKLGEEEEEEEEVKEKMQSNTVLLKQRQASAALMVPELEQENVNRGRKHDLISVTQLRIEQELHMKCQRSKLARRKKVIAAKTRHVEQLERLAEMEKHNTEEFLKWKEKKSVEMKTLFEEACKSNREKKAATEKLNDETGTIRSEVAKIEEMLNDYKRYENIMYHTKAFKAEDEQNQEPQTSVQQGLECEESNSELQLSSAHRHTLVINSELDGDSSTHQVSFSGFKTAASSQLLQEKLLSTDPQQLLDLSVELKEQILSLIQNSTRKDETLEELQQVTKVIRTTIEEDEEKLTIPINDTADRIHTEKERIAKLNMKVQLHVSIKNTDEDFMLKALDVKVTELHRCSVGNRVINFNTMEKLSSVEYHTSILLEQIENLPKENLEMLRQLKDSERRSRLHEAKLKLEREKQIERGKKCMQRSLSDSKIIRGRKLRPRCFPVEQKVKVIVEDSDASEDEFYAYLFSTEDME